MTYRAADFLDEIEISGKSYQYYSITKAAAVLGYEDILSMPVSLKILTENLIRNFDSIAVDQDSIKAMNDWFISKSSLNEIAFHPSRVLMQDFTGVPAVVDLATMRDAMQSKGLDPEKINPKCKVDLVVDHSVTVDSFGTNTSYKVNVKNEVERNLERYKFLKWGQGAFNNFSVVPPGSGICHQVNLERLAAVVWNDDGILFPDTLVGTDSHTTMVNALSVLGWGVGGIEAEAAMLGQPISMLIPEVVGVRLTGHLPLGLFATDLVLTITNILRQHGVVGKFVEFFGPGVSNLSLEERATISNMAPEFGATCAIFPIDSETCNYMRVTGRDDDHIELVSNYAKKQGLWHNENMSDASFSKVIELDLADIKACLAGPKRPQDKVLVSNVPHATLELINDSVLDPMLYRDYHNQERTLRHGDVVIAAITSCTNTSNPNVLVAAALVAKKAVELGITTKPWVKTSLAPGSKVVIGYLEKLGLLQYLEKLGFYLVGYGCTTCIGNSGPLPENIEKEIKDNNLTVASVLSGNRNFEGRVHPLTKANWLASPPLVVAYALSGSTLLDIGQHPVGINTRGESIYLKDIWPTQAEIHEHTRLIDRKLFLQEYEGLFNGDSIWQDIPINQGKSYSWEDESTYIRKPNFFDNLGTKNNKEINKAAILALLGDSITTDHISPAGAIALGTPAAKYLEQQGIPQSEFNSYGSRRGNHLVMTRGTFANIRLKNEMVSVEGGYTKHASSDDVIPIYDCAMRYQQENRPLVVIAGSEYGTGSSRDWAAKGTFLLGVKAVIAESFERIHRSNLIGMGVLPLQFIDGDDRFEWQLSGAESVDITGISEMNEPGKKLTVTISYPDGQKLESKVLCRIDTENELHYYRSGGILHYVLDGIAN